MNLDQNELVMFKSDKNDIIQSGGYKINSILKKYNTPVMKSLNANSLKKINNTKDKNYKISSIYDDLAIPAGLLYLQDVSNEMIKNNDIISNMNNLNKNTINLDNIKDNKNELIEDSLYDKLLKLASSTLDKSNKSEKNNKGNKKDDKKKTKRVRFSKYNKTRRFYK